MSDLYSELLVKRDQTIADKLVRGGMIALVVLCALAGILLTPLLLFAAMILGIAAYFILPYTDLEFEYLFITGDLEVTKIMAKSKRKKLKTLKLSECDLMAPLNSHRLDYYNGNQKLKVVDYSSGNPEHKRFAIIARDGADTCKFIFEPDEALAKTMRNSAPSKVFLD